MTTHSHIDGQTNEWVPEPGMIGLTQISGEVGKLIRFGQWLNGDGFADYEHAFVYLGDGKILEAEPGGSVISPLSRYNYDQIYWCENIYELLPIRPMKFGDKMAQSMKDIPYSFLDYFALVAHRLHIPVPGLKKFIKTSKHEICSQLADDFYWRLGVAIFTDKRWPGDVTPGMLLKRDRELGNDAV